MGLQEIGSYVKWPRFTSSYLAIQINHPNLQHFTLCKYSHEIRKFAAFYFVQVTLVSCYVWQKYKCHSDSLRFNYDCKAYTADRLFTELYSHFILEFMHTMLPS